MARIKGLPKRETGLLGRLAYWFSERRYGEVLEPLPVAAHHPRLLFGTGVMELALDGSRSVDVRLKMLAELKVAAVIGCEFCIDIGSMLSLGSGIAERQLRELSKFHESDAFSSLEKLVLEYAEAMTRTPAVIPEELFAALREHFDEAQMVELTMAIAWENFRARGNHAFGIGAEGFSEGAYCPVPETVT